LGGFIATVAHLPAATLVVVAMVAVFGASAHVPIAALIMVTEMTGGYQRLPEATFAVLLSYVVQTRLSAHLKYRSLYEAQVPSRLDSPLRYAENMQLALKLLQTRGFPRSANVGHLDLVALLDSGIPVRIPGRRELGIGVLRPQSDLVGKTVAACYERMGKGAMEIVAILRKGEVILPSRDTLLQENDRLPAVISRNVRTRIREHLAPLESVQTRSSATAKPEEGDFHPPDEKP
jgi:chloride channel protein, CIC family